MSSRRPVKPSEKEYVWEKGEIISGYDPDLYRMDKTGNVIYKNSYGKNTPMGWDVDHSKPLSKGGTYHPNNLQALQSHQNRWEKRDIYRYDYGSAEPVGVTRYDLIDTEIDKRSSLVRNEELLFNYDGTIDARSKAVREGKVLLKNDGTVDLRSQAVRSGHLFQK